jgi:hypothetical protein
VARGRKRDYAAEYARRQELARGRGFRSYYERRVRLGAGPEAPKPSGQALRAAAGHAGYRDLLRQLRDGDIVGIDPDSTRDPKTGRWTTVVIIVIDSKGREHRYTLRKVDDERVEALLDRIDAVGAIGSPSYPLSLLAPPEAPELELDEGEEAA